MTAILNTLLDFSDSGDGGDFPIGGLIADANGDLFGTTAEGGAYGDGTVFEIAKTSSGYASTPTTLVSFNVTDGEVPTGSLIADANGDLFGTTDGGGANGDGTVFEIAKTPSGYASTPTTLVSFNGSDGVDPTGSLIADAGGDLFGTTHGGGANGYGTVFEIAKTASGYASTPTTLVSFNSSDGSLPICRSDRGRQRRPVRHDNRRRRERRRHGVRDRQDGFRLRQHADHPGQLQRQRRRRPERRPDRRRQRRPVRHDRRGRRERRRHGVRDRQDGYRLRQHANHPGQLQWQRRR